METSLRLRGGGGGGGSRPQSKSQEGLRIHAKEKLPIASNALLQVLLLFWLFSSPWINNSFIFPCATAAAEGKAHGEIHAATGAPTYLALLFRNFYPRLSANLGLGLAIHFRNNQPLPLAWDNFSYTLRASKAIIPFPSNALLGINLKGRLLADKYFNPTTRTAAVELAWTILDLKRGQDVRLKLGYQLLHKMPYFQLRENNWTFNAYMDGKWDVRFDL
uniref:Outer envelope pore protein 21, chloroplastic n=1 Tax=Oryza meridionalis TaxID=40149 RepID=A0A0E0CTK3_9ORYZ